MQDSARLRATGPLRYKIYMRNGFFRGILLPAGRAPSDEGRAAICIDEYDTRNENVLASSTHQVTSARARERERKDKKMGFS